MTTTDHRDTDPHRLAAQARSILACPASVDLVVDGHASVVDGDDDLGMQDLHGEPTFSSRPGSSLSRAATEERSALLTVGSGIGPTGAAERDDALTLAGRLRSRGREACACCDEERDVVTLDPTFVLLTRPGDADGEPRQHRVPLEHFRSPAHHLNRGYLQRSVEHANDCHQDELRQAVSTTTGTRLADVVGVRLTGLSPRGVEVSWVDLAGAHRTTLTFARPARSTAELGELLRRELHAGLC
ncbi:hypothetical protein [Nocardioides sp. SYSU D00038]|uniref:hypothetical protein n=1 Tax=Nocardioides sp. SYSU D00038 TaxID=2812554 RepID=UPI0019683049|nr:hypothetical protein [Nocardioides sp. SYSU D00038]